MKKLTYQIVALAIIVSGAIQFPKALAQKIDQERMKRDLEVAETVLKSLLKSNVNRMYVQNNSSNSQYLEGYGVIISVPSNTRNYAYISGNSITPPVQGFQFNNSAEFHNLELAKTEAEVARQMVETAKQAERVKAQSKAQLRESDAVSRVEVLSGTASARGGKALTSQQLDSLREKSDEQMIEAMKTFLVDYADLISQLKDSDHIMLSESKGRSDMMWTSFGADPIKPKAGLSAEIKKSDLNAYKSGKISREEAIKRITITERGKEVPVEQDIEMLAGIFNRLYRSDLSKTYFMDGSVLLDRIPNYGAIFSMRTASSYQSGTDKWRLPTRPDVELSKEERNKAVSSLYPQFEKELKEYIVDYGRTVKSLKDDEQLVFRIQITKCEACGIPSMIEATVKGSVLKEFNAGKLDRNAAINKVNIKKGENQ